MMGDFSVLSITIGYTFFVFNTYVYYAHHWIHSMAKTINHNAACQWLSVMECRIIMLD